MSFTSVKTNSGHSLGEETGIHTTRSSCSRAPVDHAHFFGYKSASCMIYGAKSNLECLLCLKGVPSSLESSTKICQKIGIFH